MIMAASPVSGVPLMEGALVEGSWPEWFVTSRERGWDEFQKLPAPAAKDEKWRFSNVKALALDNFRYPVAVSDAAALVERSTGLGESAARFVFGNNRLLSASAPAADLVEAGLVVMTLEEAAAHARRPRAEALHDAGSQTRLGQIRRPAPLGPRGRCLYPCPERPRRREADRNFPLGRRRQFRRLPAHTGRLRTPQQSHGRRLLPQRR